jgi:hypothetical protein
VAVRRGSGPGLSDDPILRRLVAEAQGDPATLALVLTGSRAAGTADHRSDYDLVWVLDEDDQSLPSRQAKDGQVERIEVGRGRLERLAREEHWARAGFVGARVLFDRTGRIEELVRRLVSYEPGHAAQLAHDHYDSYLNGFVRSVRAWEKRDELGARFHAAESGMFLLKAVFALEGLVAPYHDRVRAETLVPLAAQGWHEGELEGALLDLARTADPRRQQQLERRVEELMESRGVRAHDEWGEQLERLKRAEL